MKTISNRIILTMILVGLLTTISCQVERTSQTQLKLVRYAVTIHDLPQGWIFSGEDWSNPHGGETYLRAFGIPDNTMIRFGHSISIYPDEKQAELAYPQWEDEWFIATEKFPGADFMPSDPNDRECQEDCVNGNGFR